MFKFKEIVLNVNNKKVTLQVSSGETLLEVLRDRLGYTGVKRGCSVGECGACTVLVDGVPIDSCIYLAIWADKKNILTVEGVSENGNLSKVQQTFVDEGAVQCGYCTPGFVMSATAMVEEGNTLSHEDVVRGLSGNLCRCTGYTKIVKAVEKVLDEESLLEK